MKPTPSSSQALQQALFRDPGDRIRVSYSVEEGCYLARCIDCSKRLCTSRNKDTCRRSAIEHFGKHTCAHPGDTIPYQMRPDPKPRTDGTCTVCGKPLPDIAVFERDPFCASTCAREYHGNPLPVGQVTGHRSGAPKRYAA